MAKNDCVLLDATIDERLSLSLPSSRRDEVFEYYCIEQLLKHADLSQDEINSGWVDGEADGGIDGFYVFVNGHLVTDETQFVWPKGTSEVGVWIITCKHQDSFVQAPLDKLIATSQELLDLSIGEKQIAPRYSAELLAARRILAQCMKTLSTRIAKVSIRFVYASRGDTRNVGKEVSLRARQLEEVPLQLFSKCDSSFSFMGAAELIELSRANARYSLELPFVECFDHDEHHVLLCRLESYSKFVSDEHGKVRRYLFNSNVRDFVGMNRVNEDIAESLRSESGPNFWLLNNGITLLVTNAARVGKTLVLDDVQIVNGLQTSESIARHFSSGAVDDHGRCVLIKVVGTKSLEVRDAIIRATNNQTAVEQQSLHATERIQRDIEEILKRHNWFYDRRTNYYLNIGMPRDRIVTPLYVAAACVGYVLKDPVRASSLKQKFMRSAASYAEVFSERRSIGTWPTIVELARRVDGVLEAERPSSSHAGERFLKKWRYLLGFICTAIHFRSFAYSPDLYSGLDASAINEQMIRDVWAIVVGVAREIPISDRKRKLSNSFVFECCKRAADVFGISDIVVVRGYRQADAVELSDAIIDAVNSALPIQPWAPGTHEEVARKIGVDPKQVQSAIRTLIAAGKRFNQRHGVLYDSNGAVIGAPN